MPDAPGRVAPPLRPFDLPALLDTAGVSYRTRRLARGARVFAQGSAATSVYYIQDGGVSLTVLSTTGKEAVVGILEPG